MKEIQENERGLFEHFKFIADKGQTIIRADKFLCDRIENFSRNKIQEAAKNGFLFANGIPIRSSYKVKPLDVISIELDFPKLELEIIPENIPIHIVFEDDDIIVINKTPQMVVHPGYGNYTGTLVNALAWYMQDNPLFTSGDPRPGLVHRIDKDTSGLLVIAKNEDAKIHLSKQFFDKTIERTYNALVWGVPREREGTISGYIGRSLKDRKVMTMFPDETHGKWSVTHYKVLEEIGYVSLVECKLETGRTHQIRTHFKSIGYPLFNDQTYGGDQILRGTTFSKYKQFVHNAFKICPRQALHAKTLGFIHPQTKKYLEFSSELPEDMANLISKWRNYIAVQNKNE